MNHHFNPTGGIAMFITLEGIEGSGKTTQIRHIAAFLEGRGQPCVMTREPGGTVIGQRIRAILLDPENKEMAPAAELLLYMADRIQHVEQVVAPSLAASKTILCDRYFDATVVYQGAARGIDPGLIRQLHRLLLRDLMPDVTFLLDLPVEEGLRRAWKQLEDGSRKGRESRFEEEAVQFHQRVRQGYLDLAAQEPERFRIIDARQDEARVREDILKEMARLAV